MKIRPVRTESFHAGQTGRLTDMRKLIVAYSNFVKAPKKIIAAGFYVNIYPGLSLNTQHAIQALTTETQKKIFLLQSRSSWDGNLS